MNAILAQSTIHRRREMLRQMTSGLGMDSVYAAILERIIGQEGDKGKLGMEVLMWISRSERPLTPEELRFALAIKGDSTELDPENTPTIEELLSCSLGLAIVDEGGSRVRLIHLTLEQYLGKHPELFGSSHAKMAEVCLTYLNFQTVRDLPPNLWEHLRMIPFLDYASCYWGTHAGKELTERTKSLALQFLDQYDHHVSAKILQVNQKSWTYYDGGHAPSRFTGLHAIACFGIAEIAMTLFKLGSCDVNGKDSLGYTPLMWAARNNNRGVCEALLELGDADPNIADSRGETPLLMASADGHEDIVKLLLERKEVNLDSPDNSGQTPLSVAVRNGHESIVKLLRESKEVNPNSPDNGGQALPSLAREDGHEGGVEPPRGNPETSETYIQKTSSLVSTPSGYTHTQKTISVPSSDDLQPQSRSPENLDLVSAQGVYTLRTAWWKWPAKCCGKR